mmetsp:Transcript_64793/g.200886  ORF Transcript_64793/g.200886 Transcript_64793/m.200886 type:complete len:847 (-) Transcript_64793:311-2851(-)
MCVDEVGHPDAHAADEYEGRPVLDNIHGDRAQITTGPAADVLAVELVLEELAEAAHQGEELDGPRHEEELVGSPDVVHVQRCYLVCVHTLHDVVAERIADDEAPIEDVDSQHEGHHALVVEVVVHPEERCVVVETNPEEGRPEPEEVREVVHGDQQASPPPHLVREEAAPPPAALRGQRDRPDNDHGQHEHAEPDDELEEHDDVVLHDLRVHPQVLGGHPVLRPAQHGLDGRVSEAVHDVLRHPAQLNDQPRGVGPAHEPDQGGHEDQEEDEGHPDHVDTPVAAQEGLQGQHDATLGPPLHGGQVVLGVLGHAVGEAPVDELGPPAQQDRLEAAGRVLDLAALVEDAALDHVGPPPAVDVAHALLLRLPDRGVVPVLDHPGAVGSAGTHAAATVADHAVQTEEGRVVVVQVVKLVLHLVEVLRALGEGHVRVEVAFLGEEVGEGRVEEVLLELVPGVADAEEARGVVPIVAVEVLGPLREDREVVLGEVQAPGLPAAGAEGHVEVHLVLVVDGVDVLHGLRPELQPVLDASVRRHLVVPGAGGHVLRRHGALVLDGLGPREVVHPQRQARPVPRRPVRAVVAVHVELRALLLPQARLQAVAGGLEAREDAGLHGGPARLPLQLPHDSLAADPVHDGLLDDLAAAVVQLVEVQLLGLFRPHLRELHHVLLVAGPAKVGDRHEQVAQLVPHGLLVRPVPLVREDHVVAAAAVPGHAGDDADEVAQHCALVLAGAARAGGYVLELLGQLRLVPVLERVGLEDAGAEHHDLHGEADEQRVDEEPHGQRLVLVGLDLPHEHRLVDVAVREAVRHPVALVIHADERATARDGEATVVEGRRRHSLAALELEV